MRWATSLAFLLFWQVSRGSQAADVRFVQVGKSVYYLQTNAAAPVLQLNPYEFRARVDLTKPNSAGPVSLKGPPPLNVTRSLSNQVSYWEFSQRFPTPESMNFTHPNGTYSVAVQAAADGKRTNVITLSSDFYPVPVHIVNFAATQRIDSGNDFTLQWDSVGLAATDVMQVRIFANDQVIVETGLVPGSPGTLSGNLTSYKIPKNTLPSGGAFRAQVIAIRKSTADTTGYPGVTAWAFYSRLTELTLRTVFPTLDVNWYGLAKLRRFIQSSPAGPAPLTAGAYAFTTFSVASDPLNLQAASLKLPNATVKPLSAAGAVWTLVNNFDSPLQLDGAYASGPYELTLQTVHNGVQHLQLPLTLAVFPSPIQISNWNEASGIDSTRPFSLKWLPLAGATIDDFIQVTVRKNGQLVFRSSEYPTTNGLDGRASSVNLPAGLLFPGESADVTLTYLKALSVDGFTYPLSLGTVASGCETTATIRAAEAKIPSANLSAVSFTEGALQFTINSVAGHQQVLQITRDFSHWSDLFITNAPAAGFLFRLRTNPAERAIGIRVLTH